MKNRILLIIKIILGCCAVWYLVKNGLITKDSILKLFILDNLPYLMLSGIIFYMTQLLSTARLLMLLKTINLNSSFSDIWRLTLIGNFFNMVLPGNIGGDFIKGFCLEKIDIKEKGRVYGIIIMDRIIGILALLSIAVVSLLFIMHKNKMMLSSFQREIKIIMAVAFISLAVFFIVFFFGHNDKIRSRLKQIVYLVFRKTVFYYIIEGWAVIAKKRLTLIYTFAISIILQLLSLTAIQTLLYMKLSINFSTAIMLAAISSVVMFCGVLPVTPGNIGWLELLASIAWSAVGSKAGGEIFLFWRIVCTICSLPGAVIYFFYDLEK